MYKARLALSALALALVCSASAMAQGPGAPAGSTGLCKDGTYTSTPTKSGACGGHKGVQTWFGPAAAPKPTAAKPATPPPAPAAAPKPAPVAANKPTPPAPTGSVTGTCKDGTTTTAASKSGACRGHGGVQSWGAGAPAPAAPAPVVAKGTPPPPPPPPPAASTPAPTSPGKTPPPTKGMPTTAAAGGGPGMVWVNTPTKVYHCPTDRYYGKTKVGSYMTEAAAQAAGDKPDAGKKCF